MTDPFGYDVQISGLANNALTEFSLQSLRESGCTQVVGPSR